MNVSINRIANSSFNIEARRERMALLGLHIFLLFLVVIVTLLTDLLPNSSLINRFLIAFYLFVSLLLVFLKFKISYILFLGCVAGLIVVDYGITGGNLHLLNDLFYFPLWCVNLVVFCLYEKEVKLLLKKNYKWFLFFAFLWNLITIVSLFWSRSFIMSNGVRAFVGFTGQSHRFAGTALFTIVCCAIVFAKTNKKSIIFLILIPLVSIFYCGARTYLVVALTFVLFLFLKMFPTKKMRKFVLLAGILLIVFAGMYVTSLRAVGRVYEWQISHYGYLHFITSGRSTFWETDLREFFASPFINLIVGRGYNFVYQINETYYDSSIWAHNDYINILIAHGFFGLALFLGIFFVYLTKVCRSKKVDGIRLVYLLLYLFIIGFNAFFNMVYTYTVASLITPLFGIVMLDFPFKSCDRSNYPLPNKKR